MHARMYVCMYVCMYVRMYACMYVCRQVSSMQVGIYACVYIHIYVCIVCRHTYVYTPKPQNQDPEPLIPITIAYSSNGIDFSAW